MFSAENTKTEIIPNNGQFLIPHSRTQYGGSLCLCKNLKYNM